MEYEKLIKKYDSSNMLARIDEFLDEFQKAYSMGYNFAAPKEFLGVRNVVGLGMGGSGMAYTILSNMSRSFGKASVEVIPDYNLPPYVGKETAVCVTSFSGNTEETLSAAEQARLKGCAIVCISTGGKLVEWARKHNIATIQFSYPVVPRVGLPYTLGIVLGLFCKAEFIKPTTENLSMLVSSAITDIRIHWSNEDFKKEAQNIVSKIEDKTVFMIGSGLSYSVAVRWKGQLNENAKTIAFVEQMPEMCHNMYLGYKNPDTILKKSAVIFLDSHLDHPQNRKRVLLVGDEFKKSGVTIIHPNLDNIKSTFGVLLAQLLLGDYVSYYLALKNNEDPLEMERIENLKKKLI